MGPVGKVVVFGLAALGAAAMVSVVLARHTSIALYSPYLPQYDLLKIRGNTLLSMLAHGGGETPPKTTQSLPFPLGIRVRLFDKTTSLAEEAYTAIKGKPFEMTEILK